MMDFIREVFVTWLVYLIVAHIVEILYIYFFKKSRAQWDDDPFKKPMG